MLFTGIDTIGKERRNESDGKRSVTLYKNPDFFLINRNLSFGVLRKNRSPFAK